MKKYNQFEIFRFIGAFSVLIFHTAKDTSFYPQVPLLFQNGTIWVYFFFVLSGFMLSYSHLNKNIDIKKFYLTRLFKFYPLYFFSLLLLFVYSLKYKEKLIYSLLMIQSLIFGKATDQNYNYASWYLSVLAFLIIIFPYLLKFMKVHSKYFKCFTIFTVIYTYYVYLTFNKYSDNSYIYHLINYFPLMHLSSFVAGMLLFYYLKNINGKKYYSFLLLLYFLFLTLFIQYNKFIPYTSILISLSFVPLIMFLFLDSGFFSKILSNNFFVYLGSLSFPMYILHVPIYHIYRKYIHSIDNNFHFLIFFIIVFVASNGTKYFIENKYYKFLCSKYLKS